MNVFATTRITHLLGMLLAVLFVVSGLHRGVGQMMYDTQPNSAYSREYEELQGLYDASSPDVSVQNPANTMYTMQDSTATEMIYANTMNASVMAEDITDTRISVELQARDIIYSVNDDKFFDILITNISQNIFNIKLSDDYIFNVFFEVQNSNGTNVKIPADLMLKRNTEFVNYRSISLYPNEEIKITVDLDKYVMITDPDVYSIQVTFFPDMYKEVRSSHTIEYNKYVISPPLLVSFVSLSDLENEITVTQKTYTDIYKDTKLIVREYNPYDIVHAALLALQNEEWDTFLSYVDIVQLYTNTNSNPNIFQLLSPSDRQIEINNFINRIKNNSEINELYPPDSFTIEETRYTNYNANIRVSTKTIVRSTIQQFVYNYILEKQNTGWKITNYTVQYVGMENYNIRNIGLGNTTEYMSPTEF